MSDEGFYYLTGPSQWASSPSTYSFSSLSQIEHCPLAWQLLNSKYDGYDRLPSRLNPAGVEGEIIHTVLEKIFRSLATYGMPVIGSDDFRTCMSELSVRDLISELIKEHEARISNHPRKSGFRLRSSSQQIQNKVIRIFREQYDKIRINTPFPMRKSSRHLSKQVSSKLQKNDDYGTLIDEYGVLTELTLQHHELPYKGILDFVCKDVDGIIISDFKSGETKPDHKDQVLSYVLLWANNTSIIPTKAFIIYTDKTEDIEINENIIEATYNRLKKRINNANESLSNIPADALLSDYCIYCTVRQFCEKYWYSVSKDPIGKSKAGPIDMELTVEDLPSEFGIIGSINDRYKVNIVYDKEIAKLLGPFKPGERLRVLGGTWQTDSIEIKPWTEVFHR